MAFLLESRRTEGENQGCGAYPLPYPVVFRIYCNIPYPVVSRIYCSNASPVKSKTSVKLRSLRMREIIYLNIQKRRNNIDPNSYVVYSELV